MPVQAAGDEWQDQLAAWLDVALQKEFDSFLVEEGWSSDTFPHHRTGQTNGLYVPLYWYGAFG